ncbi:hypothetical protein E2C01_079121 [Portunus trituberculatus]|uniref:Uncharacterized protein n=1 Tax=Portunus trituberculatus TaxID=210409 RepID=A0A5B7IW04_PORTR|nr:hypothetical protein [Portunus trituberculatus]
MPNAFAFPVIVARLTGELFPRGSAELGADRRFMFTVMTCVCVWVCGVCVCYYEVVLLVC